MKKIKHWKVRNRKGNPFIDKDQTNFAKSSHLTAFLNDVYHKNHVEKHGQQREEEVPSSETGTQGTERKGQAAINSRR